MLKDVEKYVNIKELSLHSAHSCFKTGTHNML